MSVKRVLAVVASAVLSAMAVCGSANAQKYPERPVTLNAPWAAGGGTDLVARIFGAGLEKELGQPVNIVNRTGGTGVTGHTGLAKE
jgi:tripartite-type tricarboxylate transporter receptor subunit TctC